PWRRLFPSAPVRQNDGRRVRRNVGWRQMRKIEARLSSAFPLPGILTMSVNLLPAPPPVDGRQSATALAIARRTTRYLHALGYCVLSELPLPSGRRADLVALGG